MLPATHESEQNLDYCRSILEFNNSKIGEIDTKASFLTTTSGIVLVLAGSLLFSDGHPPFWSQVLGILTIVFLSLSFWLAVRVVMPATKDDVVEREPPNDFFFRHVINNDRDKYIERVGQRTPDQIRANFLNESYTLGAILSTKYKLVRRSSVFLTIGISLLVVQVIVWFLVGSVVGGAG